jgi:hypothetical protein
VLRTAGISDVVQQRCVNEAKRFGKHADPWQTHPVEEDVGRRVVADAGDQDTQVIDR